MATRGRPKKQQAQPTTPENTTDNIQLQILQALQALNSRLDKVEKEVAGATTVRDEEEEFSNPIKNAGGIIKGGRPNEFLSMLNDESLLKDKAFQKEMKVITKFNKAAPETPSNIARRDKPNLLKVRCCVCGERDQINPILLGTKKPKEYKCNDCIGK